MQRTDQVRRWPRIVKRPFSKSQTLLRLTSNAVAFRVAVIILVAKLSNHKEINQVNRTFMITLAAAATAFSLHAQGGNPLSTEVKQAYTNTKNKIIKAAEKMPDENYNFKATPDVRTFGGWIAHVADAQVRNCAAINGEQKTPGAASKTSKADLVAALKESFADCDKAYDSLT